jgi:hypothetical protein
MVQGASAWGNNLEETIQTTHDRKAKRYDERERKNKTGNWCRHVRTNCVGLYSGL